MVSLDLPITVAGFLVGPLDRAKADALAAAINNSAGHEYSREP